GGPWHTRMAAPSGPKGEFTISASRGEHLGSCRTWRRVAPAQDDISSREAFTMVEGLSRLCPDGRVWRRSDRIRWIRLSLICAGLVVAGADALADTYYVDVELGTDGATGLSPKQAWRPLARVD